MRFLSIDDVALESSSNLVKASRKDAAQPRILIVDPPQVSPRHSEPSREIDFS